MGSISLEGLRFHAYHGYYEEERKLGNTFVVDISMEVDFFEASVKDDLKKTVNYEEVYSIVKEEMEEPAKLLENIIYRIQEKLQLKYPKLKKLTISISKLNPPVGGVCDRVKVSITKDYRLS